MPSISPDKLNALFDHQAEPASIAVTLLGAGSVLPERDRFGPATLVEAGQLKFLFDFGRGASIRLSQLKIHPSRIDVNFITHFHSDHLVGLPDLWLTSMIQSIDGSGIGRKRPMPLSGPVGTQQLADGLKQAFSADIVIRCTCDGTPMEAGDFAVTEFDLDGVIFQMGETKVTAFSVDHSDKIKPAYGFRVDHRGLTAVISGDTRYCENLIRHSQGADILVHEVMMAPEAAFKAPGSRVPQVMSHHIKPEDAGAIFAQVSPKLAVYTHLVLPGGGGAPGPTVLELEAATRKTYAGPLLVGSDLDRCVVTQKGVSVQRYDHVSNRYPPVG